MQAGVNKIEEKQSKSEEQKVTALTTRKVHLRMGPPIQQPFLSVLEVRPLEALPDLSLIHI